MSETFSPDDVAAYLSRVGDSAVLGKSPQRLALLAHLIETELAGEGENLKAYSIGLDVFGRPESFDPSSDSSVRVALGRLRTALDLFEASSYADTRMQVEIPVGTYRPAITHRDTTTLEISQTPSAAVSRKGLSSLVAVVGVGALILLAITFLGVGSTPQSDDAVVLEIDAFDGEETLSADVTSTLRRAMSRNQAITVSADTSPDIVSSETDLILKGSVELRPNDKAFITVELQSVQSGNIVWAKARQFDVDSTLQTRVSQELGTELRVRTFGASKLELATRNPDELTPEQLFVMATWVPGPAVNAVDWELERVRLMGIALEKDPGFGSAHSVMADKLAYLANVYGPSDTPELRDAALKHAQTARELSPLNPDVMFNVAQALWHSGQVSASEAAMLRVLDLDPGHDLARFLSRMIPNTCKVPSTEDIKWAIAFDSSLSPDNPIRWLTLTWIAWLHTNNGDYAEALGYEESAAIIFEIPYTFMRHAMLLNALERPDEAAALIMSQRENWPDIDPGHFATVTAPRLCQEDDDAPGLVSLYEDLAAEMQSRI